MRSKGITFVIAI